MSKLSDETIKDDIREYDLNELAEFYNDNVDLFDKLVKDKELSKNGLRRVLKYMMRIPLRSHEVQPESIEEQQLMQMAVTNDQIKFQMAIKEMQARMDAVNIKAEQSSNESQGESNG